MNNDDQFDRELRATLDGIARDPAPDNLVTRVSAIPSTSAAPVSAWSRLLHSGGGLASAFAAIAVVVAIALVATVLRPAATPPVGASPSLAVEATPTPAPTASESVSVATPTPTSVAPTPTPTPTATAVAGVPVPSGFRPMSVTFVSSDEGWVLGSAPCAGGRCPVIAHTLDAGGTWTRIAAPDTSVGSVGLAAGLDAGIAGLRFADPLDGWAFGPELWATHDGGTTWTRLTVLPGAAVVALETGHHAVHAVYEDAPPADAVTFRVATSGSTTDDWSVSSLVIPVGGGPVPTIQLVLSGAGGWILENDREVTAGAHLVNGAWHTWQPVCADVVGPAFIGASSASDVIAACDVGLWSSSTGEHLFVSKDGGATFAETGTKTPLDQASGLATPDRSTIVIAGSDALGTHLIGSFDSGRTWSELTVARPVTLSDLGFTTASQGVVISTGAGGASQLFMTRDGGRTWSAVTF